MYVILRQIYDKNKNILNLKEGWISLIPYRRPFFYFTHPFLKAIKA